MSDTIHPVTRPMNPEDVAEATFVMNEALAGLAASRQRPHYTPGGGDEMERVTAMVRHFMATDPAGAIVASDGEAGEVLGMALSTRRDDVWGLACLFVAPEAQGKGIGRRLLDSAAEYGMDCAHKAVVASDDPAALSAYQSLGLVARPGWTATGTPQADNPQVPGISHGDVSDLDRVNRIDERVRGAQREQDVRHLLEHGATLLFGREANEHGYAIVRPGRTVVDGAPILLAAETPTLAASLLTASLALADGEVEVYGLTESHQWAIETCRAAGLRMRPGQSVFTSPDWPRGSALLSGLFF